MIINVFGKYSIVRGDIDDQKHTIAYRWITKQQNSA